MSFIQMTTVGNLGKDPETKTTQSGEKFAVFTVAANTGKDETTWVDVAVFHEATAQNVVKYLKKGDPVLVQGQPTARAWEGNEGPRASLSLNARQVTFLSGGEKTNKQAEPVAAGSSW